MEIRLTAGALRVREAKSDADGTQQESRTITGTAIVFNTESEVIDDYGDTFREIIRPEACTKEFIDSQDIKMNMLHDRSLTIARSNKGTGSLRISVDKKGVNFEFEAPRCDIGDRCLEMVRRGDYSGCSFEFYPQDYEIKEERDTSGNSHYTVTHTKFRSLSALTIAMDPAYTQTSVSARELHDLTPEGKAENERRASEYNREKELSAARRNARMREIDNL